MKKIILTKQVFIDLATGEGLTKQDMNDYEIKRKYKKVHKPKATGNVIILTWYYECGRLTHKQTKLWQE